MQASYDLPSVYRSMIEMSSTSCIALMMDPDAYCTS